jgi:4-alpha-glucanotransferase
MMKTKENSMYNYLSIEQIRSTLDFLEISYGKAMDEEAYGHAQDLDKIIDDLMEALTAKIMAEDPCTTAADVRYFEKNG